MAKKLAILVHKKTNSVLYTSSKTNLATLLGVSLRTIIRKYKDVGMYESIDYIIYIGAEKYENNIEKNYKHDVTPPIVKTYNSINSPIITNNVDKLSHSNQFIEHDIEDNNMTIERDWKDIEKDLILSEYRSYYIKRTEEQLKDSYDYFINRPGSTLRITIINECAKIKQLE